MSDLSSTLWAALIGGVAAVLVAFGNALVTRNKNKVDAAAVLTDSALAIVKKLEERVEKLERLLDLQEDINEYLWHGIDELTEQVEELGAVPRFKPKRIFRGKDGREVEIKLEKNNIGLT